MRLLRRWSARSTAFPSRARSLPVAAWRSSSRPSARCPPRSWRANLEFRKSTIGGLVAALRLLRGRTGVCVAGLQLHEHGLREARVRSRPPRPCACASLGGARRCASPGRRFARSSPFGAGVHAKRLLDYTAQQGDNLVVGKFMGMTALGLYDKAFSTMNRFLARMNTGGPGVMFRIFAVIHEEPERFRRAYQRVMMSASLAGAPRVRRADGDGAAADGGALRRAVAAVGCGRSAAVCGRSVEAAEHLRQLGHPGHRKRLVGGVAAGAAHRR